MTLKDKLKSLLLETPEDVTNYFCSEFCDEYLDEDEDVLDFLTENFHDIDMLWAYDKSIEEPVRKTLNAAIQMIERKQKGQQLVSVNMNMDDYRKMEKSLPDIFPEVSFFIKEADQNLVKLGLCESAPCVVMFNLDNNEFEDMLDELNEIEIDAFNTNYGEYPKQDNPAYQKYLKYGCLYEILYNAEQIHYSIGKVKYVGKSFGGNSLTDGKIYIVIGIEDEFMRVIDDSGVDYLYSIFTPGDLQNPDLYGKWEIIEDPFGALKDYIK